MKHGIFFLTFTIIIGMFSLNTASASIVTDGLVSYWTFDRVHISNKTAKDVWGDNNGTIIGNLGNPKVVPGRVGEALKFDGVDDFVNLTMLGDFGKKFGTASFEAWIKTTNKKDWMTLVNTRGAACPNWGIELNGVNRRGEPEIKERMLYHYIGVGDLKGCSGAGSGQTTIGIFDGEWHHIVYTNNYRMHEGGGNGKSIIYIDGVVHSGSNHRFEGNRAFSPFTAPVHLGARKFPGKSQGHFTGMIDEVRFYDRPLTAREVFQNFESTEPYDMAPKGKLSTVWATLKTKL